MRSNLDAKCLLFGLAMMGWASGCVDTEPRDALGSSSQADTGSVCAFVIATVGGQSITTPSVVVIVPDASVTTDPIHVHVDPTTQTILGYSLETPGVDHDVAGQNLFVTGPTANIPSFTATLPIVDAEHQTCAAASVATPAVPIIVPESDLQIPGVSANVPAITVTFSNEQVTTPGKTLTLPGRTIVIPEVTATVPPITVSTPEKSVSVTVDATAQPPVALPPAIILAPQV
jgi:hypothetical protein